MLFSYCKKHKISWQLINCSAVFRFPWGSWVNIYCRHFSILVQKQRFSTHSSLGFLSWLYVGPVPDFALTSFDFLHTNKWLKSVGLINHRHWITTAAAAAATCCQGDIILGNLSTRSGWCFGANGGGESTRGAAERPISSTAIHAKGRKSDLERKKEVFNGMFTLCYLPDRNNLTHWPYLPLRGLCIQAANYQGSWMLYEQICYLHREAWLIFGKLNS